MTWLPRRPVTQQILPNDRYDWLSNGGTQRLDRQRTRRAVRMSIWLPWVVAAVCLVVAVWRLL